MCALIPSVQMAVYMSVIGTCVGVSQGLCVLLAYLELDEQPTKLIGFGCDGANVNMGDNGVRELIQSDRPWVVTVWCFFHRLELAIQDALKSTYA